MGDTPAYAIGNAHAEGVAPGLIPLECSMLNGGSWKESLDPGHRAIEPGDDVIPGGFESQEDGIDEIRSQGCSCRDEIIPGIFYPLENGVEFINDPLLTRLDGGGYGRKDGMPDGRSRVFQIVPLGGYPGDNRMPQPHEKAADSGPHRVPQIFEPFGNGPPILDGQDDSGDH